MGYRRPYSARPVKTRLFAHPVDVFPGAPVYFRVRTTNTIIVYVDLWQVNAFASGTRSNYWRGL